MPGGVGGGSCKASPYPDFFEHHLKNHILSIKAKGGAGWLTIALQPKVEAQSRPRSFLKAKKCSAPAAGLDIHLAREHLSEASQLARLTLPPTSE
jgi:hypothetical protein